MLGRTVSELEDSMSVEELFEWSEYLALRSEQEQRAMAEAKAKSKAK